MEVQNGNWPAVPVPVTVPPLPDAVIVIVPLPLVILTPWPADNVALVKVLPVEFPINNCPSVKVVWPVPPCVTGKLETTESAPLPPEVVTIPFVVKLESVLMFWEVFTENTPAVFVRPVPAVAGLSP